MTKIKSFFVFALALVALVACKESNADYRDVVYISGTQQKNTIRKGFEGNDSVDLSMTCTAKVEETVKGTFVAAPELLDAYNAENGSNYIVPPTDAYRLKDAGVTIAPGQFKSTSCMLEIADPTKFEEGKNYCLPVRLKTDGNLLESGSVAYIVFVPIITVDVADIAGKAFLVPSFRNNEALGHLSQLTMECKVFVKEFQRSSPYISTLMGCEENFLLRFGDVSCDPDQLQLAGGKTGAPSWDQPDKGTPHATTFPTHFPTGKWCHFACVYDGKQITMYLDGEPMGDPVKATGDISLVWSYDYGTSYGDNNGPFAIGYSAGGRHLNGRISEFRVWNVARTPSDLLNHICYVDPKTPGLIAYWRFQGPGDVLEDGSIRDWTGHGYNAVAKSGTPSWVSNHKCPY
ncbi:PF08522 domain protein [Segatella baroniae F0067]|uniref:PF08522 domain protein n=1 Tax=Segatella baroniae F0067 TaxID=1115809 RepID=U2P547_9BACT|nr:DUF1735 and LamG domain-containing protein [Segatella baroniae]ERK38844.1 PF08522 domain protein [Segatella baroniae F0067]